MVNDPQTIIKKLDGVTAKGAYLSPQEAAALHEYHMILRRENARLAGHVNELIAGVYEITSATDLDAARRAAHRLLVDIEVVR